ncbi:MAG TPA: sugar ABC transporter permease [bacterium]|nr:sugar ABC transporter permease [bacterium]
MVGHFGSWWPWPGVRHRWRHWFITFSILPALLAVLAGSIYPFGYTLFVSFHDYNLTYSNAAFTFNGLSNYLSLLTVGDFWYSLRVSAIFTVVAVSIELALGVLLASLLNYEVFGRNLFRSLLLTPMTIAPIVVGLIWRWLYNAEYGLINYILGIFGGRPQAWVVNPHLALGAIIITDIWEWTPFIMLIVLAGLQTVPVDVIEAAILDGANSWQRLRFVVLPIIRNVMLIGATFRLLDAFRSADTIFSLTGGGPGRVTTVEPYNLYLQAFQDFRIGYAAAMSIVLIGLTTLVVSGLMKIAQFE